MHQQEHGHKAAVLSQWETGLHMEARLAEIPKSQHHARLSSHFPSTGKVLSPSSSK